MPISAALRLPDDPRRRRHAGSIWQPLEPGAAQGNLGFMRRPSVPSNLAGLIHPNLLPSGQQTLRRAGGFVLLGCSFWLVTLLALARSVIGLFH
jgi:hypothetical protein